MNLYQTTSLRFPVTTAAKQPNNGGPLLGLILNFLRLVTVAFLTAVIFYLSLITTSAPVDYDQMDPVRRAMVVLEKRGFTKEVFLLSHVVTYRSTDNWLNGIGEHENAFAATNFPFEIITLYPDFYTKAKDDTERAMILLHEAQHLTGASETDAYGYVWLNRQRLGWTRLKYGTTDPYITIEEITRAEAPRLFTCANKVWDDCTETLFVKK